MAVELLMIMEQKDRARDFAEQFKLAVVSADPQKWIKLMYPKWSKEEAPAPEGPVEHIDPVTVDLSEAGEWVFTEAVTKEEAMKELEEMDRMDQMIGGMSDLVENDWIEE